MATKRRKLTKSKHKPKLGTLTIKIPVTIETLTAVLLVFQELVALARVVKLPLQTEKEGAIPLVAAGK